MSRPAYADEPDDTGYPCICVYIYLMFSISLLLKMLLNKQDKTNGNPEAEMKKICFHLHILALVND